MRAVLFALIFCAPVGALKVALRGTKDSEAERVPRASPTKLGELPGEGTDLAARVAVIKALAAAAGLKGLDANPKFPAAAYPATSGSGVAVAEALKGLEANPKFPVAAYPATSFADAFADSKRATGQSATRRRILRAPCSPIVSYAPRQASSPSSRQQGHRRRHRAVRFDSARLLDFQCAPWEYSPRRASRNYYQAAPRRTRRGSTIKGSRRLVNFPGAEGHAAAFELAPKLSSIFVRVDLPERVSTGQSRLCPR